MTDSARLRLPSYLEDAYKRTSDLVETERFKHEKAGKPLGCGRGCSACCHQSVRCLPAEVDLLLSLDMDIDYNKLSKQVNDRHPDMTCVFLTDNECSVYEHRPLVCRAFIGMPGSELCLTKKSQAFIPSAAKKLINKLMDTHGKVLLHRSLYYKGREAVDRNS